MRGCRILCVFRKGCGSEILDESDLSANITNEYVFFGGERVAMYNVSSGTICYYEDDMQRAHHGAGGANALRKDIMK